MRTNSHLSALSFAGWRYYAGAVAMGRSLWRILCHHKPYFWINFLILQVPNKKTVFVDDYN